MDHIEPSQGISTDEGISTIESISAAGDFRFANKRGRSDSAQRKRTGQLVDHPVKADDEVALSDVAHVSLLEEEGTSVSAVAADLGLTTAAVFG
jgi:hypothetical protein